MANDGIVDSHVHLYPQSEVATLAWCDDKHLLNGQYSVEEYLSAIGNSPRLRGFVFIEADRKSHLQSEAGWKYPLGEVDWITRVAAGTPKPGEGHKPEDAQLCLAVIPWAPIPLGAEALERYVEQVKARAGSRSHLIKGFRYLVQDKPEGTMTQPKFIESLRWLGEHDYTFDLGVDHRKGGEWQLEGAYEMIHKAHEGVLEEKKITVVISKRSPCPDLKCRATDFHPDHMCKPNMRAALDTITGTRELNSWAEKIHHLALLSSKTYMKVSGGFSEIDPLPCQQTQLDFWTRADMLSQTWKRIMGWIETVLEAFGPDHVMFGSDWPVCNLGGGGNLVAWKNVSLLFDAILSNIVPDPTLDIKTCSGTQSLLMCIAAHGSMI